MAIEIREITQDDRDEEFNDKVEAAEDEAKEAFYSDSDNVNEAAIQEMTMDELWLASKADFIRDYFAQ